MSYDLFSVTNGVAVNATPFLTVTLALDPRGWARPRAAIRYTSSRKPYIHFYKDAETRAFEDALTIQGKVAMRRQGVQIAAGPLAVRLFAMMRVPKSWSNKEKDAALVGTKWATVKPDHDNISGMLDAFNKVVWFDDAQVVISLVVKEYAESPGLIVEVYRL